MSDDRPDEAERDAGERTDDRSEGDFEWAVGEGASADGPEGPDDEDRTGPDENRVGPDGDRSGPDPVDAPERSAPLADLADEVAKRRDRDDEEFDAMFSEESVGEVDRETLWQQVTREEETEADRPTGRVLRVVKKASYCQQCQYFTEPPTVACTHEGTEILEVADSERFLVANCPVVREDEELGDVSNVQRPEEYDGHLDAIGGEREGRHD